LNTANEQTKNSNNDFQNSNLTNSGSKKFTRDYDKEPITIRDHNPEFAFIASIASVPLIILMLIYFPTNEEKIIKALFYVPLLISPIVFEYWFNDRLIRFKNDKIEYLINSKLKRSIKIGQISDIKRTADSRYEYFQRMPLICAALIFVYLILGCLVEGTARFVLVLGFIFLCILISYFAARILFQILGKRGKYRYFENIVIYGESAKNFINILPKTDSQRSELKAYFLRKLGKNIDEAGVKFFIFFDKR
jgi:hypothetical protein